MDLTSVETIKELMAQYNSKPSKIMGQNFLINKTILEKIIEASDLSKKDVVLEVGPGIGTLTKELTKMSKKVVCVEKDTKFIQILKQTLKENKNVEIINADALKYKTNIKDYKVVSNIPYYLTSVIIRKFLESKNQPKEIVLMVQKEIAQRICAKPPEMSLLAVSVQFYAEAKIISYVSKNCFWPSPKVDSAIIKIIPSIKNKKIDSEKFFRVVKAGFSQPRKQLANNFYTVFNKKKEEISLWLSTNGIKPSQRAETLKIDEWIKLSENCGQLC